MDGYVTIGTELDTQSFDAQIEYVKSQLDEIEHKLKQADMGYEVGDVQKLEAEYEKLNSRLSTLVRKKQELETTDLSGLKKGIDGINDGLKKTIKNIARWALGVFAIRSAYLFVRNAINTIAQDDEQLNADLNYIKTALAYTIEPLVRKIVEWAKMILQYVGFIIQQWTGKNIFANANKHLEKQKKNAQGLNKELSKTLAKFDEMNVVGSTTGGGTSAVEPGFTLGDYSNLEVPAWLQWIVANKDVVLSFLETVGILLVALKLGEFLQTLGLFGNLPLWTVVAGLALVIGGIALAIKGVLDFIEEPTWQNFLTILEGIALAVAGISLLMGNWIVALVALGVALVAYVIQNWDKIKEILGKVGSWIYDNIIKPVGDFFSGLWKGITNGVSAVWNWIKNGVGSIITWISNSISNAWNWIKNSAKGVVTWISNAFKSIVDLFKNIGTKVGDAIGGAFKTVINGVLGAIESILNFPIKSINKLINKINEVPGINLGTLNTFSFPRMRKGGILNNPGKGVYVGGAIAGEGGKEFYMPLEDDQMLSLVGEAIGKRISLTATIPVYVGNRQLTRETRKIELQDNFAYNR